MRIEDLGENWHYTTDADKLPVIREAIASGKLKLEPLEKSGTMNRAPFCQIFTTDFLDGKFKVIEPDYQALSDDDPRLGEPLGMAVPVTEDPFSTGEAYSWNKCGRDPEPSPGDHTTYMGLAFNDNLSQLPPYRIYHTPADENAGAPWMNVALHREDEGLKKEKGWRVTGYSHAYWWVDLKACESRSHVQILSPIAWHADGRDALSLLIRYQGRPMVLAYQDWAAPEDPDNYRDVELVDLAKKRDYCRWKESRLR